MGLQKSGVRGEETKKETVNWWGFTSNFVGISMGSYKGFRRDSGDNLVGFRRH